MYAVRLYVRLSVYKCIEYIQEDDVEYDDDDDEEEEQLSERENTKRKKPEELNARERSAAQRDASRVGPFPSACGSVPLSLSRSFRKAEKAKDEKTKKF